MKISLVGHGGPGPKTSESATSSCLPLENQWFKEDSSFTPRKINMEPENDGLQDDFPFQLGDF